MDEYDEMKDVDSRLRLSVEELRFLENSKHKTIGENILQTNILTLNAAVEAVNADGILWFWPVACGKRGLYGPGGPQRDAASILFKQKHNLTDSWDMAVHEIKGILCLFNREGMANAAAQVHLSGVDHINDLLKLPVLQPAARRL